MLVDELKRVQADTFALYSKTHFYHWNVEGPDFVQYHKFLNKVYDALFLATDSLAEQVRQLDSYAPHAHKMLMDLTQVKLDDGIPEALEMFKRLLADNDTVMEGIVIAYMSAEAAGELGLSNFLQDRMMYHKDLRWRLKSITK
jgi:starvation-inducible DNA-binding protein